MVDPSQFENAILNLTINARDAMPKGGKLVIETVNKTLDSAAVAQYQDMLPGDYVEVAVTDTGTGMTRDVIAKAFEPFFTTKDTGKGSGLGLSMVCGFAKQSGGHVAIYSRKNQGTAIKFYLPRALESAAEPVSAAPATGYERASEHVLVVEDEDEVRMLAVNLLRRQGYTVSEASSGPAAVDILKSTRGIDVLFTDIVLPGEMNGVQVASAARALHPKIRIIYTSGYAENAFARNGQSATGAMVLHKPYRRANLLEKIRMALDAIEPRGE